MTNKEYRDSYVAGHISNTVASQILVLREARGWTQKELAEKTGMGQSRISALEDPNYENIQVGTLRRLASAFDVGLTVRFVPFSEVVAWTSELSAERLLVADFATDTMPHTTRSSQVVSVNIVTYTNRINQTYAPPYSSYGGFGYPTPMLGAFQFKSGFTANPTDVEVKSAQPCVQTFTLRSAELVANG